MPVGVYVRVERVNRTLTEIGKWKIMGPERRDDVGGKILVGVLIAIIGFSLTSFIGAAWSTASEGKNKAWELSERVTTIEARFGSIQSDLSEIKDLLKRRIP